MKSDDKRPAAGDATAAQGPGAVERPLAGQSNAIFGSDVIARALRSLEIPYIALNPGASYRGLHDSIVNYLGNEAPQMLLCLHEESAVAVAHGYAKVTGKPMLAAVHSNVGLMHAAMAVFNAWCDRAPLILIGATGPVDAARRRPFIDWIHTTRDQGALVRDYTKWDEQPASVAAAQEAIMRAAWHAQTEPKGPVYINLDSELQESPLDEAPPDLDPRRFLPRAVPGVSQADVERLVVILKAAKKPVLLYGRMARTEAAWQDRVALAEHLGARVVTHRKEGSVFPTDHPLQAGAPTSSVAGDSARAIREADVVVSFYWLDLAGSLKTACGQVDPDKTIVHISTDHQVHKPWSMDHQAFPPADLMIPADPDDVVAQLLAAFGVTERKPIVLPKAPVLPDVPPAEPGRLSMAELAAAVRAKTWTRNVTLLHVPTSFNSAHWHFHHPDDYIGADGGGGIGAGPGISVGAALALAGSGRFPLTLVGDGDYLMGVTALWTAVHYRIPLLMVVANNQSFYNDEVHQQKMALARGRPPENKWIGQRMADPEIDLAKLAEGQGALGLGPARDRAALDAMLDKAIAHVDAGGVAVIDARVIPGYSRAAQEAMAGNLNVGR